MIRTQISLTEADRRALEIAAARTGLSMSALIREAIERTYGTGHSAEEDLVAMRRGRGVWTGRDLDGEAYVELLRTGTRVHPPS